MSEALLEFDHVWKKFKKGEIHNSLRDLIPAMARAVFSKNHQEDLQRQEFWALKDISFQVGRGEAMGIIGPNGAGKSTILKLVSGILWPNVGKISAKGRVSALIEVGAGFHPDLTGRENVQLYATILGMKRAEIAAKFDEIVAFAALEDFIDTPVKRYSSGMFARLGFAVAAHIDPDILLVDEVLSVGDMEFQGKCLEKMTSLPRRGTSVIFVSHNLAAVSSLCSRSALIMNGSIQEVGNTRDVMMRYVRAVQAGEERVGDKSPIREVRLEDEAGRTMEKAYPGQRACLKFCVEGDLPLRECILSFLIQRTADGLIVCDYTIPLKELQRPAGSADTIELSLGFEVNLLRGAYTILLNLKHAPTSTFPVYRMTAGFFWVDEMASWQGVAHLNPKLVESGRL